MKRLARAMRLANDPRLNFNDRAPNQDLAFGCLACLIDVAIAPQRAWISSAGLGDKCKEVFEATLPGRVLGCDRRTLADQPDASGAGGPADASRGEMMKTVPAK